jgi:deoxyribodipyrimidine photo-lyase
VVLWWVRRDLRLFDNPTLAAALRAGTTVLPVFVLDPALLQSPYVGRARTGFLLAGLRALDTDLRARALSLRKKSTRRTAVAGTVPLPLRCRSSASTA